jgi:hypothetical protein
MTTKTYRSSGGWVLGSYVAENQRLRLHPKQAAPYVQNGTLVELGADGQPVKKVAKSAKPTPVEAPVKPATPPSPRPRRSRRVSESVSASLPQNLVGLAPLTDRSEQ